MPSDSSGKRSLLISLPRFASLNEHDGMLVTLRDSERVLARKTLHQGDPDLYTLFDAVKGSQLVISSTARSSIAFTITVLEWPATVATTALLEGEPNDTWQQANQFKLGQTVWATADDKPYISPLRETSKGGAVPYQQLPDLTSDRLPEGGIDWFKFTYEGEQPKLAHFELDLVERDNI